MTFWVFTDGDGGAYLYLTTYLNADVATVGSTYMWGTAFIKMAGQVASYDVGLCTHQFTGEDEIGKDQSDETWNIIDMWITESPFN